LRFENGNVDNNDNSTPAWIDEVEIENPFPIFSEYLGQTIALETLKTQTLEFY